jgi:XTP/dITP diphosphohydrolase
MAGLVAIQSVRLRGAMREILIATSNPGKLRDYAAAAAAFGVEVSVVPDIETLPPAREDAPTFEANACKKAEHYSRLVKGRYVLADDSGLEVDALGGAPGVRSARYAADAHRLNRQAESDEKTGRRNENSTDAANNARLLAEMHDIPDDARKARFVCVIAVAYEGRLLACFRGGVSGTILHQPRGNGGFGYDPLFYVTEARCTFAELTPGQKAEFSHRGQAFRKFLNWYTTLADHAEPSPRVRT